MTLLHLQHRWEVVKAEQGRRWFVETNKQAAITIILRRCAGCGENDTKELDGLWTVAELRGKS